MKQTINNSIKNMATIITVPYRTKAGGISPNLIDYGLFQNVVQYY